jgi:hypothetical protein
MQAAVTITLQNHTLSTLSGLSDAELVARVKSLAARERQVCIS